MTHSERKNKLKEYDEIKCNEEFANDTDEIINLIESITSHTVLCKTKELYENIYHDVSQGEIYYKVQKSTYATKFEITISDGRNIADVIIEGDYDTIPQEVYQAIINKFKAQAEKILPFLDDKIHLAEKQKKESDRKTIRFIIISGFLFYCFLIILLGIKYTLHI